MCGRFTLAEVERLSRQYGFDLFPDDQFPDWTWRGPRFNITPHHGSPASVTTAPNALLAPIQNRMPVLLDPDAAAVWRDATLTDPANVLPLLAPYPAEAMEAWPVSALVNGVRNDGPELIAPIAA